MFFFLTYFALYNRLQFHPPHYNWFKCILLNSWVIFHCVYVPQLFYPFVCQWTSRLLPCPSYCKQCCNEHWGTCVSFISGFLGVYAQQWDFWVIWEFYFQVFKESSHCSPEKAMATHSSTLAWKIPWTEEPGGLQSMGLLVVGHDWTTSLSLFTFMHWRRKWQPTPVFWPGESQGRGSLVGCRLWGRTELDTAEAT